MTLLIIFNAVAAFLAAGRAALTSRRATPLDVLLGRIPWPGSRKTPRAHGGAGETSPSDGEGRRISPAGPDAVTSRPGARRNGTAPVPHSGGGPAIPRGKHCVTQPLVRGLDGLLHTGPMQAIPDGYGSLPDTPIDYWPSLYGPARQQRIAPGGETLRAARGLVRGL